MSCNKYSSFIENQTHRHSVSQTKSRQSALCRDLQEMIDLLCNTDDLDLLVNFFSALTVCLLTERIKYARAVKCDPLYNKLALVLKSGVQTKVMAALNFISAFLYQDNENALTRRKALNVYAKNMIRISGCLAAMSEMFISFMMHQDTWKALCCSISEACDDSYPNQSYCSHLVPLCIQRCQQGNTDIITVLKSLLWNHQGNINMFHESNGMTIFNRQYLQNPAYLQLLNSVVENTKPENRDDILKASHIFQDLQFFINKYGRKSSIGQWASIILFSHRKAMKTGTNMEEDEQSFKHRSFETIPLSISDTKVINETIELLQNVLKEVIGWQNQPGGKRRNKNEDNEVGLFAKMHKSKLMSGHNAQLQGNAERFPVASATKNDLSYSFLLNQSLIEPRLKKRNPTLRSDRHLVDASVQACYNEPSQLYMDDVFERSFSIVSSFKPRYTSTPNRMSEASTEIHCPASRNYSISHKIIDHKRYRLNTTLSNKINHNSSMSTFFGIVNGSCSRLFKGLKHIFATKKTSENIEDKSENNSEKNVKEYKSHSIKKEFNMKNITKEFSLENTTSNFCMTCNDTVLLRRKLTNDVFLQQAVNSLKLGINLYGCDFKKISRTMWPREPCMTPNVLYNLYRKLIINEK